MDAQADLLWRVNNEYRKRLSQTLTFLNLLEQMLRYNDVENQAQALEILDYIREQVDGLIEEQRAWRYRYYYESPDTKRMVQGERPVGQALARFNRMRAQQETRLTDMYNLLYDTPRPDPSITRVPKGDLWTMTQYAIYDLLGFSDSLQTPERTG